MRHTVRASACLLLMFLSGNAFALKEAFANVLDDGPLQRAWGAK